MLISIENLQRDVASDGDTGKVSRFVDAIVASLDVSEEATSPDRLYWNLEPNDYEEPPDIRAAISNRVDRVLVHLSSDGGIVTWITRSILSELGMSESEAEAKAFSNLARELNEAKVELHEFEGVRLGFINTSLLFKASLILAPNLREVIEPVLGWPLMAVVPDRDFLYLWAARDRDFVQRVRSVVVREYSRAPYPISTEVYEITEQKIRAIGEFPTDE